MLNFSGIGTPIAKIKNDPAMNNKILCVSTEETNNKMVLSSDNFNLDKEAYFQMIPDQTSERPLCATIFGMQGSGKTYFIADLANEYHNLWNKNPIFFISNKRKDEKIDNKKFIKRVPVEDFIKPDRDGNIININDFVSMSPCLIIFDDIDSLTGIEKKQIYYIVDKILKDHREDGISIIVSLHGYDGKSTTHMLNQCKTLSFFTNSWNKNTDYLLDTYIGATDADIDELQKHKGYGATTFFKTSPHVFLQPKTAFIINKKTRGKKNKVISDDKYLDVSNKVNNIKEFAIKKVGGHKTDPLEEDNDYIPNITNSSIGGPIGLQLQKEKLKQEKEQAKQNKIQEREKIKHEKQQQQAVKRIVKEQLKQQKEQEKTFKKLNKSTTSEINNIKKKMNLDFKQKKNKIKIV